MKKINTIVAMAMMMIGSAQVQAQDQVEASVSADVVSRYVWRGQALGDASVQPSASLSYKGLSLGAWGSYDFLDTKSAKEFDLTLSYTTGGLNVGVTDYWFSYYGAENKYFRYSEDDGTAHVLEANLGYDFGPVAVQWYTNFYGADGVNKDGDKAYSSYFEVSAPFELAGCDWTAKVGGVPYATSFYEKVNGFALTNISLRADKEFKLGKCKLPVFVEGICNPSAEKGYLVVGFSIK